MRSKKSRLANPPLDYARVPYELDLATAWLSVAVPLTSAVALLFYLVLRHSYVQYYRQFNLTPEDAGLGYVEVLVGSLGAILLSMAMPVMLLIAPFLLSEIIDRMTVGLGSTQMKKPDRLTALVEWLPGNGLALFGLLGIVFMLYGAAIWILLITLVALALLALLTRLPPVTIVVIVLSAVVLLKSLEVLPQFAEVQGRAVKAGLATTSFKAFGGIELLGIRASAATVQWMHRPAQGANPCLMYIGNREGTTLFYDPLRKRTLQVPSSQIIIELRPVAHDLPRRCVSRHIHAMFNRRCLRVVATHGTEHLARVICGLFENLRAKPVAEIAREVQKTLTPNLRRQITPKLLRKLVRLVNTL